MKKLLINNLGLKIASLIIAVVMYTVISYDGNASLTALKYPFAPIFPANVYVKQSDLPPYILVSYRGPFAQFRLNKENVPVFAPTFNKVINGKSTIEITSAMLPQVPGLEITGITPSTFTVESEPIIEHDARIDLNKTGNVAANFKLDGYSFEPSTVTIRGPASAIQNMDYIYNKVFDVSGLDHSVTTEVELQDLFYPMHYVNKQQKVSVTINIEEQDARQVLRQVPIILESNNPLIILKSKPMNIVVQGKVSQIKALDSKSAYLSVTAETLENLTEGSYNLPTQLRGLPDEITPIKALPLVRVEVKVEVAPVHRSNSKTNKNTARKKTK